MRDSGQPQQHYSLEQPALPKCHFSEVPSNWLMLI